MPMHKMFKKMHMKHRGTSPGKFHGMHHGLRSHKMSKPHEMWNHMMPRPHEIWPHMSHSPGHGPHGMRHHRMHPHIFQKMHKKHHHMKHHGRSSSCSSSSSSESEDETLTGGIDRVQIDSEQIRKDNPCNDTPASDQLHDMPPNRFQMMLERHGRRHHMHKPHEMRHFIMHKMFHNMHKNKEGIHHMKPEHHGPCDMMQKKQRMGHHKMHPRKLHKMHGMRPHKHMEHHMVRRLEEAYPGWEMNFHKMHHKIYKKHCHMNRRGRSSSQSSSSPSGCEDNAPVEGVSGIQDGDK